MRIIFIEVRSKTALFAQIAKELTRIDNEIAVHWIVQNKAFDILGSKNVHYLSPPDDYPARRDYSGFDDIDQKVISCDRFYVHFKIEPWHYKHYRQQLEHIIDHVKPTAIFGELGNFFTHYVALIAKLRGIPFFDPETARFPNGHMSFFQYDEWAPLKLQEANENDIDVFLQKFRTQTPLPDYMQRENSLYNILRLKYRKIKYKAKVLQGYMSGERYCTQNPLRNVLDKALVDSKLKIWDASAITVSDIQKSKKRIMLYPMQMQPEFNLEVWGYPFNNQNKLITDLLNRLPKDWLLLLKANPKPFFELNRLELVTLLRHPQLQLLDRTVSMQQIEQHTDLVVTVTGTVQIERILTNRPVFIIGNTPFREYTYLQKPLDEITECDLRDTASRCPPETYARYAARFLLEHSMPGIIAEPVNNLTCLKQENIKRVTTAFLHVLRNLI